MPVLESQLDINYSLLDDILNTNSIVLGVHSNLLPYRRVLPWVLSLEDLVQFLKSAALGHGDEEVDDSCLEEVPDDKDDVCPPCDLFERNRPSNWLIKPAALTAKLEKAIPSGRISKDRMKKTKRRIKPENKSWSQTMRSHCRCPL